MSPPYISPPVRSIKRDYIIRNGRTQSPLHQLRRQYSKNGCKMRYKKGRTLQLHINSGFLSTYVSLPAIMHLQFHIGRHDAWLNTEKENLCDRSAGPCWDRKTKTTLSWLHPRLENGGIFIPAEATLLKKIKHHYIVDIFHTQLHRRIYENK